jgi:hypothetical protein
MKEKQKRLAIIASGSPTPLDLTALYSSTEQRE